MKQLSLFLLLCLGHFGASSPVFEHRNTASVPVGTIIAWNTDSNGQLTAIPQGWELCNGQLIQGDDREMSTT